MPEKPSNPELLNIVDRARKSSRDTLESAGKGFVFPVPEKVRNMDTEDGIELRIEGGVDKISKADIVKTILRSLQGASREIEPMLPKIREQQIKGEDLKDGVDFFTNADTRSEAVIRETIFNDLGKKRIRLFGEEENKYLGNLESHLGFRVDPIDGTRSMKFGTPDWAIMVGAYEGVPDNEKQIVSGVLFPEMEGQPLILNVSDQGVFITNTATGEIKEINESETHNELNQIITTVWEHTDYKQRGKIKEIEDEISAAEGHVVTTRSAAGDVLEALKNGGKRAMIIDGDYNEVDFISAKSLESIGFRAFTWEGEEVSVDDPDIAWRKLVMIPPGQAGEQILEIVKEKID